MSYRADNWRTLDRIPLQGFDGDFLGLVWLGVLIFRTELDLLQ